MDRAAKARKLLATHHAELNTLVREASETGLFDAAFERMKRWKARTVEALRLHVHSREGDRLAGMRKTWFSGDPLESLVNEAKMYDGFIRALDAELKQHPKSVLNQDSKTKSAGSPSTVPSGSASPLAEIDPGVLTEIDPSQRWRSELSAARGAGKVDGGAG